MKLIMINNRVYCNARPRFDDDSRSDTQSVGAVSLENLFSLSVKAQSYSRCDFDVVLLL